MNEHLPPPPDFALLRRLDRLFPAYRAYFRAELLGFDRLPPGPALLVGNHNGGWVMPEAPLTVLGYHRATGFQDPLTILGHDTAFALPGLRRFTRACGGTPARPESALAALAAGRRVLVYPGGDHEVMRPSRDRDKVDFGGRAGFARVALRAGVPIVPVVCAGAHDVWWVVARGARIARWTRLDRSPLRLGVCPVAISFPWGLGPGFLPFLPFPARVRVEVGAALHLEGDPDDPRAVHAAARQVLRAMQAQLDRLVAPLRV
ncbi:MAG: 1-acyl-sn-glycerol-3-phosphate acyltransferase [Planctomycetota bacterium]